MPQTAMPVLASPLAAALVLFALTGCDDDRTESGHRDSVFKAPTTKTFSEDDRKAVDKDIKALAHGKDVSNPESSAANDEAVRKLINRGSGIEVQLVEALAGSEDWGIRLGVIEVLSAIGTRACVEPLINRLDDSAPLVAYKANGLLEALCNHKEIPATGTTPDGLTAVPKADRSNPAHLELDTDEKLWAQWHAANRKLLLSCWRTWWAKNKGTVKIQ